MKINISCAIFLFLRKKEIQKRSIYLSSKIHRKLITFFAYQNMIIII